MQKMTFKNYQAMSGVADMTFEMVLKALPQEKLDVLDRACYRTFLLTSYYGMSRAELEIYKEGFYLSFEGCRSTFSVYVEDNDGELIVKRKPRNDKLHALWRWGFSNIPAVEGITDNWG